MADDEGQAAEGGEDFVSAEGEPMEGGEGDEVKSMTAEEAEAATVPPEDTMVDTLAGMVQDVDACTGECMTDGDRVAATCLDELQERALLEARELTGSQVALKIIDRLLDAATGAKDLDSQLSVLPKTESAILHALLESEHQAYIKSNIIDEFKDDIKEYWRSRDADPKRQDEDVPKEIQWKQHALVSRLGEFDAIARRVHRLIALSDQHYSAHDFLPRLREHSIALAAGKSLAELRELREEYTWEQELEHVCCPYCTVEEQIPKVVVCGPADHVPMVVMCDPIKKKVGKLPGCDELSCAAAGAGTGSVEVGKTGGNERTYKECPRFHGPEDLATLAGANMLLDQINYLSDEVKKLRVENLKVSYQLNNLNMFQETAETMSEGNNPVCPARDPRYIGGLCPNGPRPDDDCPKSKGGLAETFFPHQPAKPPTKGSYYTPDVNICTCPQDETPKALQTASTDREGFTCPGQRECMAEQAPRMESPPTTPRTCPFVTNTPGVHMGLPLDSLRGDSFRLDEMHPPMRLGGGGGGSWQSENGNNPNQYPCGRPDRGYHPVRQDMGQPKFETCYITRPRRIPTMETNYDNTDIVRPCPPLDLGPPCRVPTMACPLPPPPPCGLVMTPCPNVPRPPCHRPKWPPEVSFRPKKKRWPPELTRKQKWCSGLNREPVPNPRQRISTQCPCPGEDHKAGPWYTMPSARIPEERDCPHCHELIDPEDVHFERSECACMHNDPGTLPLLPSRDPKQRRLYDKRCVCPPVTGRMIPCVCGCTRSVVERECSLGTRLGAIPRWQRPEDRSGRCARPPGTTSTDAYDTPCAANLPPPRRDSALLDECPNLPGVNYSNPTAEDMVEKLEQQLARVQTDVRVLQDELVHVEQTQNEMNLAASLRPRACETKNFAAECDQCNR